MKTKPVKTEFLTIHCIFHKEKTPSLCIDKQRYYCYSCGATGETQYLLDNFMKLMPEASQDTCPKTFEDMKNLYPDYLTKVISCRVWPV